MKLKETNIVRNYELVSRLGTIHGFESLILDKVQGALDELDEGSHELTLEIDTPPIKYSPELDEEECLIVASADVYVSDRGYASISSIWWRLSTPENLYDDIEIGVSDKAIRGVVRCHRESVDYANDWEATKEHLKRAI